MFMELCGTQWNGWAFQINLALQCQIPGIGWVPF